MRENAKQQAIYSVGVVGVVFVVVVGVVVI
jgi:hypothetical protein